MNERRVLTDRARIVLVTGAPGSRKTTLGAELARSLRIPFVARDDVRGGLFFTDGGWTPNPRRVPTSDEAVETLLQMVETEMNDALLNRRAVLDALGKASIEDHTTEAISRMESVVDDMRTDFDVPVLQVATDHGYQPGLHQIIDFVVSDHRTR